MVPFLNTLVDYYDYEFGRLLLWVLATNPTTAIRTFERKLPYGAGDLGSCYYP